MNRRRFLATIGASTIFSGCVGSGETGSQRFQGPQDEDREFVDLQYRDYPVEEVSEIKDSASTPNYRDLLRNVEDYAGEFVVYAGIIAQTLEGDDYFTFLVAIDGRPDSLVYASWTGDRYIAEDTVRFWGEVIGNEIYQTAMGSENTVPAIAIADIEHLNE